MRARRPWLVAAVAVGACDAQVDLSDATAARGTTHVLAQGDKGPVGWWPSLRFDNNGRAHLSFCDVYQGDLIYAAEGAEGWTVARAVTEGAVGKYTALGLDAAGRPGIAFYDQDQKYLRFAWLADGRWSTERVAWGLEVGMGGELLFDAQDRPNLFYYVPSGKLVHAVRLGPNDWSKQEVAAVTGGFSVRISPVLRSDGFWITFVNWNFRDTALFLARPGAEGGYVTEVVSDHRTPGWRSQLLFEGNDNADPLVFFSQGSREQIRFARRHGNEWDSTILTRYAATFSASLVPGGDVVVVYQDISAGRDKSTLRYARRNRASTERWQQVLIDAEPGVGEYLTAAVSASGRLVVAYTSPATRSIKIYQEALQSTP